MLPQAPIEISCGHHELIILNQNSIRYIDKKTLCVEKDIPLEPNHVKSISFLSESFLVDNDSRQLYEVVTRKVVNDLNKASVSSVYNNQTMLYNAVTDTQYQLFENAITIFQKPQKKENITANFSETCVFNQSIKMQTINTLLQSTKMNQHQTNLVSFSPNCSLQ